MRKRPFPFFWERAFFIGVQVFSYGVEGWGKRILIDVFVIFVKRLEKEIQIHKWGMSERDNGGGILCQKGFYRKCCRQKVSQRFIGGMEGVCG